MPVIKIQGLKGLPGLNRLSDSERSAFMESHKDILNTNNFKSPRAMKRAADVLYNNDLFINKFGEDYFNQFDDGTESSYNARNELLKNTIINDEFTKYLSPFNADGTRDNNKGLGSLWEQYNDMSPDAKLKLMESDWWSPTEFSSQWQKHLDEIGRKAEVQANSGAGAFMPLGASLGQPLLSTSTPKNNNKRGFMNGVQDFLKNMGSDEGAKQLAKERNDKILQNIYNDDLKERTNALGSQVSQTYLQDPEIANLSDDNVKKAFYNNFVDSNSDMVKLGGGELAAHWGSSELKDLSIDDMRQWLAKKKVYMQNMNPQAASTALNNEAKEYIKDHQGSLKRMGLFLKDVGISAMSYTADKANGIYDVGLMIADAVSDKPKVLMDDSGNIIDPKTTKLSLGSNGTYNYTDGNGKQHTVRQVEVGRTTLHNMGKNFDGSEDTSILNPQYWNRAEQFGTLDSDEQKKYEKLGASPYKVAYNPNEDSDLWYEAFKMSSFGIADAASQLIPFGIGAAGKALSTASRVGRVARGLGKAIDFGGKALTAQTKFGQIAQGTAGALGIAYAYNRGAFQETLAQNLANADEVLNERARNDIYNSYNNDKEYKGYVDGLISKRAAELKKEYLQQVQNSDGGMKIADMNAVDKLVKARAQEEVMQNEVQDAVNVRKGTKEYADLQQEAINSAGDAANATFLPEAVKYGMVNTMGFRKYLYTNPSGVTRRISNTLKGLKEITTEGGKQRLATEASKFLTKGQKWKQLGKTAASQAWGGAWTNGTDDMMTDAAERINNDSYDRYLNGFLRGEAIADTYGFADGLYSYLKGFSNSLGQENTMNSTIVGAVGSLVSASPNFANIAHLATREGRENYRNTYWREYQRDANNVIERDANGQPIYTDKKSRNIGGQINYFIQNGVLSTYYGKKQAEKDLQNHADYVNNILDDYNDFEDIENLVMSDRAIDDAESVGDKKTARFIKAMQTINVLNSLARDEKDPAVMSSVVENAKNLIDGMSEMDFDAQRDNIPDDENVRNLVAQYYAQNPDMAQNPYNDRQALSNIIHNAKELKEASEAYSKAETEVQKAERNAGYTFAYPVREKLKLNQALDGHWRQRLDSMKEEIGDTSSEGEIADDNILPSVGGKKNAQSLVKAYNKQEKELEGELKEANLDVDAGQRRLADAQKELSENTDESKTYELQQKVAEAQTKLDDAQLQTGYIQEQIATTRAKRSKVENAVKATEQEGYQDKVLTADEIMSLDPVTRARMMRKENRDLYSDAQKAEITKLEKQLTMRDADALQKIQDISTLTQRINSNSDAYNRIMQNPEAAAVRFEAQRSASAVAAYNLINQRNAEITADFIRQFDEGLQGKEDVTKEQKEQFVYKLLRSKLNGTLLNLIDEQQLLPQYQKQVADAIDWVKVTDDLDAVVSHADQSAEWKANMRNNIDNIVETANNRDEIMSNLEKAIDDVDNPTAKADLDVILQGMEKLGYQRDAVILEGRKQRKEREDKARKEIEEKKQKAQEDAQIAAAEEAAKKADEENAQTDNPIAADGSDAMSWEAPPDRDLGEEDVVQTDEQKDNMQTVSWTSTLMEDGAEDGTVDAGEMWYGGKDNASKGNLTATLQSSKSTPEKTITFKVSGKPVTFTISPNDWKVSTDNSNGTTKEELGGISKDTPFKAEKLYSVNGRWYFDGKFEGNDNTFRLEVADSFNLDDFLDRQRASREAEYLANGIDTGNKNLIDDGDIVQGKSETIDEQAEDNTGEGKPVTVSDNTTDATTANTIGEDNIENNVTTLSGNAMSEYEPNDLAEDGVLKHKKGASPTDSMNRFYNWMKNAGIHLQNIIDTELGQILMQNPHAKVKFMAVSPNGKATDDVAMQNHLLLVLDYDNSINKGITNIHNKNNGGVVTSSGKQYLIIGVAGYNRGNTAKRDLYDILYSNNPHGKNGYGIVRLAKGKFFREHPSERYYVHEGLETEVVPQSLIPGYIVRQLESDSNPEYRPITEVLADKERNPFGLTLDNLNWGIQELSRFMIVGNNAANAMIPRNVMRNLGNAFVLIPASNGRLVPAYLKPLFYNEMRDGALKNRVMQLVNDLTAMDYKTRLNAVIGLSQIFYLDKDGDNFLLRKSRSEISLVHAGQVFKTFVLDSNFDRQAFMEAVADMNPRVNITARVLKDVNLLKEWAEAGALDTDAARLATAGSSYSIYGLDSEGNMLGQQGTTDNITHRPATGSDFRNDGRSQVVYRSKYYTHSNDTFYLNGIPVTDEAIIAQLQYNWRILDGNILPSETQGIYDTYVLSNGDNPEVVRINKNTKEVTPLSEEDAKAFVDKLKKEEEERKRKAATEEALQHPTNLQDVNLEVDDETGELNLTENEQETSQETQETDTSKEEKKEETPVQPITPSRPTATSTSTQTFKELYSKPKYKIRLLKLFKSKWKDAPKKIEELTEYLRKKNIEVDAIGTSEEDIDAWIKTIEDCR